MLKQNIDPTTTTSSTSTSSTSSSSTTTDIIFLYTKSKNINKQNISITCIITFTIIDNNYH